MALIRVSDEIHRAAKARAALDGQSLGAVVEGLLNSHLGQAPVKAPRAQLKATPAPQTAQTAQDVLKAVPGLTTAAKLPQVQTCRKCNHPRDRHRPEKDTEFLRCEKAGCFCRLPA
jgi:hypothetical protein